MVAVQNQEVAAEGIPVPSATLDPTAFSNAALFEDPDELLLDTIDFLVPHLELPLDRVYYQLPLLGNNLLYRYTRVGLGVNMEVMPRQIPLEGLALLGVQEV